MDALKSSNLNYPAGTIEEHFYQYLIRTMGEFKVVPEIGETIVGKDDLRTEPNTDQAQPQANPKNKNSRLILLKDISEIKDTFQEKTSISRYNGKDRKSVV